MNSVKGGAQPRPHTIHADFEKPVHFFRKRPDVLKNGYKFHFKRDWWRHTKTKFSIKQIFCLNYIFGSPQLNEERAGDSFIVVHMSIVSDDERIKKLYD